MAHDLKKTYLRLLVPAIFGFAVVSLGKTFDVRWPGSIPFADVLGPAVFIGSVAFALALPLLFRTIFAHRVRQRRNVSRPEWVAFETRFLAIALVTPYLALIGFFLELPRFHMAGTILMALYAAYFYYPSDRRVAFERRIFRVK